MLEKIPGGHFHFEIAVILRNALLISSVLSNSEVWYGLTKYDTGLLEQLDEMWIRNLFVCSRNVSKDLLYLELGLVPIRYIIKARRQIYLHHILQQKEDSLLYSFFVAQMKSPNTNDWVSTMLEDQEELGIDLGLQEIKAMTKSRFSSLVREKTQEQALFYLLEKKHSRTSENAKGKLINYSNLKMTDYLSSIDTDMSIDEKKWLFLCRIEDIDLQSNRKWNNEDTYCKSCPNEIFTQRHLLYCKYLMGKKQNIIIHSRL